MNAPLSLEQQQQLERTSQEATQHAADQASRYALDRNNRQSAVVKALQAVLPKHALLWNSEDTTPYECDGLTA